MACQVCGGPVPARGRGRPAVYCSQACRARAYRARKGAGGRDADPAGAAVRELAATLVTTVTALAELATGTQTGTDRPRVGELEDRARQALAELTRLARARTGRPAGQHDETPAAVTETAVTPPAETTAAPEAALAPSGRDESPAAVTESERAREDREWQEQAERERAEFERRLKPVPEFGDGYQMAEWPGTGRHHLVYRGERIGHAAKKPYASVWQAYSAHGTQIPATGTYKTRRDALIQVALHHERMTKGRAAKRH